MGEARLVFHIIIWLHVLAGLILPYPSDSIKRWKRLQTGRGLLAFRLARIVIKIVEIASGLTAPRNDGRKGGWR